MKFSRQADKEDNPNKKGTTLSLQSGTPKDIPPAMPNRQPPKIPSGGSGYNVSSSPKFLNVDNEKGKKLLIGEDICLSGEIKSCEKLVVEGTVEANIMDCRELVVSEGGLFRGEAKVEVADIAGEFSGIITSTDLLILRSTGRITGTITYGRLEVECGGVIKGDIIAGSGEV